MKSWEGLGLTKNHLYIRISPGGKKSEHPMFEFHKGLEPSIFYLHRDEIEGQQGSSEQSLIANCQIVFPEGFQTG